jgi:hypothetical protein
VNLVKAGSTNPVRVAEVEQLAVRIKHDLEHAADADE